MELEAKTFDVNEAVAEAIITSPDATTDFSKLEDEDLKKPSSSMPVICTEDSEKNNRHGRTVSKLMNLAHKEALGENMDSDFVETFGEVFGGLFNGVTSAGAPRWLPLAFVSLFAVPAVGVVGFRIFQGLNGKKEESEK